MSRRTLNFWYYPNTNVYVLTTAKGITPAFGNEISHQYVNPIEKYFTEIDRINTFECIKDFTIEVTKHQFKTLQHLYTYEKCYTHKLLREYNSNKLTGKEFWKQLVKLTRYHHIMHCCGKNE